MEAAFSIELAFIILRLEVAYVVLEVAVVLEVEFIFLKAGEGSEVEEEVAVILLEVGGG